MPYQTVFRTEIPGYVRYAYLAQLKRHRSRLVRNHVAANVNNVVEYLEEFRPRSFEERERMARILADLFVLDLMTFIATCAMIGATIFTLITLSGPAYGLALTFMPWPLAVLAVALADAGCVFTIAVIAIVLTERRMRQYCELYVPDLLLDLGVPFETALNDLKTIQSEYPMIQWEAEVLADAVQKHGPILAKLEEIARNRAQR